MDQPPVMPPTETTNPGPANDTSKVLAALSYPIWIVALIAILIDPYKNEKFVRFHAIQALGFNLAIFIVGIVLSFVPFIQIIDILLWPVWIIVAIIWAVKAYNGEYAEMPVVYGFVRQYV